MNITTSKQFSKDLERVRRGSKLSTFRRIEDRLKVFVDYKKANKPLPPDFEDHQLNDNKQYKNCRECHLRGDTLLIYKIDGDRIILTMLRIGSHSDLFEGNCFPTLFRKKVI